MGIVPLTRRKFLQSGAAVAGVGLITGCGLFPPQLRPPTKVPRIGILGNFPSQQWDAFRAGLGESGYVEGQSVTIEVRWSDGIRDRFPSLATELLSLDVDVIVASGNFAARAARDASATVPIVVPNLTFPVWNGFVASLAHPGGNITGLSVLVVELDPKRLELLKQAVPGMSRVVYLADSQQMVSNPELHDAARALGVHLTGLVAQDPAGLDAALQDPSLRQTEALLVSGGALLHLHRARILETVATLRLPAMYPYDEYIRDGGLMLYGPNQPDLFRRAAGYVDRILKGSNPADMPIELPERFDFVINVKAARTLGIAFPEPIVAQATEVIQ